MRSTGVDNRPGFISATGAAVAAVVLAALGGWTAMRGPVLFSPGALNAQAKTRTLGGVTSHAQLAGQCGACHAAPWSSQTMADKCLACHTDVRGQTAGRTGLHARLVGTLSSPTCRGCHPEHHGAAGALTAVDSSTFPHDLTGYSLRGHRRTAEGTPFSCKDCHPTGLSNFSQTTCSACHTALDAKFMSQHEKAFGKQCLSCHNGAVLLGGNFNHNRLPFKLEGKHANLACERCHSGALSLGALQTTPQDCRACHAKDDKHRGAFGQDCGQCHNPGAWSDAKFDHSVFPVDHGNEERKATCQTCHPTDVSTYTCYGCHAHTPANVVRQHEGGRSAAQLQDCIRCHRGGRSEGGD